MREHLTIPGIGTFRVSFDQITLCSDVPKADLVAALPVPELKACSHAFQIEKPSWYEGSRLVFTCLPDAEALLHLRQHEAALGKYKTTRVEATFDIPALSLAMAKAIRDWLVCHLGKLNHERGYIVFAETNAEGERLSLEQLERRGLVDEPTVYFEKEGAAHNLKLYIRKEKLAQGGHGAFIVRLEWTSTRSRAVTSHFGGNQIGDLLDTDLGAFMRRFLVLEEIDYTRLGRLIGRRHATRHHQTPPRRNSGPAREHLRRQLDDEDYWARRRAHLLIMVLEQRSWPKHANGEPIPEDAWRASPAQIKGRFRDHFAKLRKKADQNKEARPRRRSTLTMKKLEECFTPIPLETAGIQLDEQAG